ncbi:MAG: glucokinase [Actinomycetales bacterium]|nr:MAG: glucokinase [Actinomycetales bacterium]
MAPRTVLTIGIDIGGTKIAGGVVDPDGRLVARARAGTPDRSTSAAVVEDAVVGVVHQLIDAVGQHRIQAVGIGAAGFVAADRATVIFAPHLPWRAEPLHDRLSARLRLPITIDNDANAAAWAEYRYGAGRGETHMLMVNLGTGIGGGIVLSGRLERGRFGIAGEFGHQQVVPEGLRCECGNRGCWEQYSSGNALVREARSLIDAGSPMARELIARTGGDPGRLTGPLITEAAREGDRTAIELLADVGQWLGVGIANLTAVFDPGRVVVGGGVSAAGELLLGPARATFRRQLTGRGHRPEPVVVAAELGNDAGVVGAADLARLAVAGESAAGQP